MKKIKTPVLLKTISPIEAPLGLWHPVAAWAVPNQNDVEGFPWALASPRDLSLEGWEYTAFTAHFITGLRDVYEHTFDAWGRIHDNWHTEQLLNVTWAVEEVAQLLNVEAEVADQFLMWRTLHTRVPDKLLQWFSLRYLQSFIEGMSYVENLKDCPREELPQDLLDKEAGILGVKGLPELVLQSYDEHKFGTHYFDFQEAWVQHFLETWASRSQLALEQAQHEYEEKWIYPTPLIPLFEVSYEGYELFVKILVKPPFRQSAAFDYFFNYVLTGGLLNWSYLFKETEGSKLRLQSAGLSLLRNELHARDVSGRIGACTDGIYKSGVYEENAFPGELSDESLRLLLHARLLNVVGPQGLWFRLGLMPQTKGQWKLCLPSANVYKNRDKSR